MEQFGQPEDAAPVVYIGAEDAEATRHEQARLEAVHALHLLEQPVSESTERVVQLAAELCGSEFASINIVDEEWLHSIAAVGGPKGRFPREDIPCDLVVRTGEELIAADATQVPQMMHSPVVDGTLDAIGFYASVPLRTLTGHVVGTLCAWDQRPQELSVEQLKMLRILADHAVGIFQMSEALERARLATEELARQSAAAEDLFAAAFQNSPDGIVVLAVSGPDQGRVIQANPAVNTVTGRSRVAGLSLEEILDGPRLSPDDRRDRRALMEDIDLLVAEPAGTFRNETLEHITRMPVGTGHIHVHLIVTLTRDAQGRAEQLLVQMRDVTAQQAHEAWLAKQTQTDPLTGLGNQLAMQDRLAEEIGALRFADNGLGVMMIDLDNFRTVNDRLGHPAGDDLLCRMTAALVEALPVEAFASRVGGDEFVVLTPSSSAEKLRDLADEVSAALSEAATYFSERLQVLVGASIGLTFTQNPAIDPEELIKAADAAMYETKRQRRFTVPGLRPDSGETLEATTGHAGPRPTLYALPSPRGAEPVPAPTPAPRVNPEPGETQHPAHSRHQH